MAAHQSRIDILQALQEIYRLCRHDDQVTLSYQIRAQIEKITSCEIGEVPWRLHEFMDFCYRVQLSTPDMTSRLRKLTGELQFGVPIRIESGDTFPGPAATASTARVVALMRLVVPASAQDEAIGDLLEKYQESIEPKYGARYARVWLWRHGTSVMLAYMHWKRWGLILTALWTYLRQAAGH